MIERKFIAERMKEFQIQEFISETLKNVGHSHTKMQRTPLGEKIIIFASRPGLIVGRKGENINKLTRKLKSRFKLENPQIEISEVENIFLDAQIVAERIASTLERFGIQRFKGVGHKTMGDVMDAGALGIEIIISGKVPSTRARNWRFYQGYLKKCGDTALQVRRAYSVARLKTGIVGIKVSIMPPDIFLPDKITPKEEKTPEEEKKEESTTEESKEKEGKKSKKKKTTKKKKEKSPTKKKAEEKEDIPAKEETKETAEDAS